MAALAPVVQLEHRVGREITAENVEKRPARVAFGRLDLHDIGTPVGQDPSGPGPGDPDAELDHPDAAQAARSYDRGVVAKGWHGD